jgi:type I restriction-modification system DNA methylase subunit
MWGLALKYGFSFTGIKKILEPAAGIGRMLEYVPSVHEVTAYEIDKYAYTIAKITFSRFTIINQPFETHFWDIKTNIKKQAKEEFDLVIGNPPYRDLDSKYTGMKDVLGQTEKNYTGAFTFDQYMLMRGIDVLLPGGLLIFIIPNSFLSNDSKYNDFKNKLAAKADLIDAYRLPSGVFASTQIGTDIVVFKKK